MVGVAAQDRPRHGRASSIRAWGWRRKARIGSRWLACLTIPSLGTESDKVIGSRERRVGRTRPAGTAANDKRPGRSRGVWIGSRSTGPGAGRRQASGAGLRSNPRNRRACRSSDGRGPGPPCRSSSRSPRTSRGDRDLGCRHRSRRPSRSSKSRRRSSSHRCSSRHRIRPGLPCGWLGSCCSDVAR